MSEVAARSIVAMARELASRDPTHDDISRDNCPFCFAREGYHRESRTYALVHGDDCPWLAMPRIVAALEAAQEVLALIDDVEFAQDSLRHADEAAALRLALGADPPWSRREP